MTLHRFFVPPETLGEDRFPLPAMIERQVRRVLRLGDGDRLVLLPGDGTEALCVMERGQCVVEERRAVGSEPRHRLTVVQALLKGDALDEVVRQATEIGVARFRLVVSERSVARELSARKLGRLGSIAREAAEQSERGIIPSIEGPTALLEQLRPGSILLHERHHQRRLGELEPTRTVIIGPEGGFTPAEVDAAIAAGVTLAWLGPRVLRARTVAVAAAAVILSRAGDFA